MGGGRGPLQRGIAHMNLKWAPVSQPPYGGKSVRDSGVRTCVVLRRVAGTQEVLNKRLSGSMPLGLGGSDS